MAQTAMAEAMLRARLVSKEQVEMVEEIPWKLRPYQEQIQEIRRLTNALKEKKLATLNELLLIGSALAFQAMRGRGEVREAYEMLVKDLRKVASEYGIQ